MLREKLDKKADEFAVRCENWDAVKAFRMILAVLSKGIWNKKDRTALAVEMMLEKRDPRFWTDGAIYGMQAGCEAFIDVLSTEEYFWFCEN